MSERLEHFGRPCYEPSSRYVDDCWACNAAMYEGEVVNCPACDNQVHRDCLRDCPQCGQRGCQGCFKEYMLDYFCGDDCLEEYKNANTQ